MKRPHFSLEQRTLKVKLFLGFSSLLLMIVGIGLESLYHQQTLNESIQWIHDHEMAGLIDAKDAQMNYALIGRTLRQAILSNESAGKEQSLLQLSQARGQLTKNIENLRARPTHPDTPPLFSRIDESLADYLREVDKVLLLLNANRIAEAQTLIASKPFQESGVQASAQLAQIVRIKEKVAQSVAQQAQKLARQGLWLTAILVICGVILGVLSGTLVSRSIRKPLDRLRDAVLQLSKGNLDHKVPHTDDPNEFGELARAIAVLQTEAQHMETERWIKTHSAMLSSGMQIATNHAELARHFFSGIAPLIQLGHGAFYLYEEEKQQLRLLGSYARHDPVTLDPVIPLGHGLTGQCANDQQPIVLHDPPEEYLRIVSALSSSTPRSIAVFPVMRGKRLMAVLELATLEPHGPTARTLLDNLLPLLAISLEVLDRRAKPLLFPDAIPDHLKK